MSSVPVISLPDRSTVQVWVAAVAIAFVGGVFASLIGTPLPWLLGAMVATAAALAAGLKIGGQDLSFPQLPRMAFITVIGVAIGGTASPQMLAELANWWPSLAMVMVFVGIAQVINYQIFRRLAGYDKPTAYYCATPGGLIESVQLGEEAGGNATLLTVQHFSRIAITVSLVPLIYWVMRGEAVGSAAGVSMENGAPLGPVDALILAACALLGGWGGRRVGLPAAIITGPIILSALAHGTGLTEAQLPDWLIAVAQLVIGLGLAMRFRGMTRALLLQGIGLGLLTVSVMLTLGAGMAAMLDAAGDHAFQVLLMCFAPGGVVEMGLIALSLGVSPMMVTLHHIVRIGFTVVAVPLAARWVIN
ncbi:MAG: AbrB family transcriptional regulator [Pseudomonadota bacterium]